MRKKEKATNAPPRYAVKMLGEIPDTILPEGWIGVYHFSGAIVYLHRETRVVTWSRPYTIPKETSLKKHNIPLMSIPCLHQKRSMENYFEKNDGKRSSPNEINGPSTKMMRMEDEYNSDGELGDDKDVTMKPYSNCNGNGHPNTMEDISIPTGTESNVSIISPMTAVSIGYSTLNIDVHSSNEALSINSDLPELEQANEITKLNGDAIDIDSNNGTSMETTEHSIDVEMCNGMEDSEEKFPNNSSFEASRPLQLNIDVDHNGNETSRLSEYVKSCPFAAGRSQIICNGMVKESQDDIFPCTNETNETSGIHIYRGTVSPTESDLLSPNGTDSSVEIDIVSPNGIDSSAEIDIVSPNGIDPTAEIDFVSPNGTDSSAEIDFVSPNGTNLLEEIDIVDSTGIDLSTKIDIMCSDGVDSSTKVDCNGIDTDTTKTDVVNCNGIDSSTEIDIVDSNGIDSNDIDSNGIDSNGIDLQTEVDLGLGDEAEVEVEGPNEIAPSSMHEYLGKIFDFNLMTIDQLKHPVLSSEIHDDSEELEEVVEKKLVTVGKTPFQILNEYCQKEIKALPVLSKIERHSQHDFTVEILIKNFKFGIAGGDTLKQAKHNAASNTLNIFDYTVLNEEEPSAYLTVFDKIPQEDKSIISTIEEFSAMGVKSPYAMVVHFLERNFAPDFDEAELEYNEEDIIDSERKKYTLKYKELEVTGECESSEPVKEIASQAFVNMMYPQLKNWGSIIRLQESHTNLIASRDLETQSKLLKPNKCIMHVLRQEMHKIAGNLCA